MTRWRNVVVLLVLLALATLPGTAQEGKGGKVELKVVKYDELAKAVLRHRGKVVVVDFWADYCVPCKKNMPHLVELYAKNAGKGLAVITVSIDDVEKDPAVKDRLLRFLTKQNATFTNVLLDEPPTVWMKRLEFKTVPTVFVFDRQGKWQRFTDEVDPHEVEKLVVKLLKN